MSEMCSLPLLNCHGNFAPRNFGLPDQNFHQTKLSMTEHFVAIMSCLYLEGQLLKGCMFTYKWIDMFFFCVCVCVPQGAQGEQGLAGPFGPPGPQGFAGLKGMTGETGVVGPQVTNDIIVM